MPVDKLEVIDKALKHLKCRKIEDAFYTEKDILYFLSRGLITGKEWDYYRENRRPDKKISALEMERHIRHHFSDYIKERQEVLDYMAGRSNGS